MNTGQAIDFSGPCSWIPGSRAEPAPRNDDLPAFFRSLLGDHWRIASSDTEHPAGLRLCLEVSMFGGDGALRGCECSVGVLGKL
jgi:hypothetical protein